MSRSRSRLRHVEPVANDNYRDDHRDDNHRSDNHRDDHVHHDDHDHRDDHDRRDDHDHRDDHNRRDRHAGAADVPDDGAPCPIDYRPALGAARTAIHWALDLARTHAPEADDIAAINRVERAAIETLDGLPMCCRPASQRATQEDVLVTAGILIERFELDFRIPGLTQIFGALYESADWLHRSTAVAPTRRGHAARRHGDAVGLVGAIAAQLERAPRVAHGLDRDVPVVRLVAVR